MKAGLLMKKLWTENRKFIDSKTLKDISNTLNASYENMIRYLLSRDYLIRIFKGIFYVKSSKELNLNQLDITSLELVSKGLELKGVKNWYFGLYTALGLNNVTHEYFSVNFVVNDKLFRANKMEIADDDFKFIKIKPSLIFGIKKEDKLKYSDLEKTVLDFVYLWRYRGIPEEKIISNISKYLDKCSHKKLKKYLEKYPKTVRGTIERAK